MGRSWEGMTWGRAQGISLQEHLFGPYSEGLQHLEKVGEAPIKEGLPRMLWI